MMGRVNAYHEVVGNLHVHTLYSDGSGTHRAVAEAAAQAGLDFVITTDHNIWVEGAEGYYAKALLLVGEEVHHVRRLPPCNHLLVYGAEEEMALLAADPQRLIDEVNNRGGLCFLAHPFEKGSRLGSNLGPIPWADWQVSGYVGLEVWNTMSEFKGLLLGPLTALFYALSPSLAFRGPFRATLRQWDRLLGEGRHVAAIGGADAHATTYRMGSIQRVVFPYEALFRWVNTHLLLEQPLSGELSEDKRLIYEALRAGRTWAGYDRAGTTRGFTFRAHSGAQMATLGEELPRAGAVRFEVEVPARGLIRLLHAGRIVARAQGRRLRFLTADPGAYRVEVLRFFRGRWRGWIYSSPIYVR
jgi:hypothetical protein